MRALVTGAAGFLGMALVRLLVARGHAVRAFARPGRSGVLAEVPGVELFAGDATDPASMRAAVRGCDVVFHLAGVRRAIDRAEFLRVNAGSTRVAIEAALSEAPNLSRFVLAGSLAASGPSRVPRREEEPFAPVEPYGESKAEAERIAMGFADRLPVAVARPPRIMGPGDRENLLFFRIAKARLAIGFTGPARPLSWIDVDDCAAGFVLAAERPEATGESFFLASEEPTSAQGLMLEAARALGVRARRVQVPPRVLRGAAAAAELVSRATGWRLPLNRKLAAQVLAPGWVCDAGKARERLGFTAPTSLSESIDRAAHWYRTHGLV
jgi:nucleoside-diphosphate-sugar epimerase